MIVIRETRLEDIENLYNYLNSKYVKKYCKNTEIKEKELYEKWYRFLINSSDYTLYTIEDLNRNFLGSVKFQFDSEFNSAEIFIYLIENIRGLGYSTKIIDVSISELKFRYSGVNCIFAYILEENECSISCFKKAGFKFEGQIDHGGVDYLLYIKKLD